MLDVSRNRVPTLESLFHQVRIRSPAGREPLLRGRGDGCGKGAELRPALSLLRGKQRPIAAIYQSMTAVITRTPVHDGRVTPVHDGRDHAGGRRRGRAAPSPPAGGPAGVSQDEPAAGERTPTRRRRPGRAVSRACPPRPAAGTLDEREPTAGR